MAAANAILIVSHTPAGVTVFFSGCSPQTGDPACI